MSSGSLVYGLVQVSSTLLAFVLAVFLFLVVYRLTLHPLARVPGPVLAATTGLHEAYFQLAKEGGGRHWIEVERLHKIYGPIVRINPWEVHIQDPNWNDVFKLSSKASKPWWYYKSFGNAQSTNTTGPDQLHRINRQALQTWFSSQNVARHAPTVQSMIDRLHDRLLDSSGKVVNLSDAYRCLAVDVATGFAFQRAFGNLDDPKFSKDFNQAIRDYGHVGLLNRYFFGVPFALLQSLPKFISSRISSKAVSSFMAMISECAKFSLSKSTLPDGEAQDMVQSMLKSDLPPAQKRFVRIFGECRSVVLAGTETTATVLTSITYSVLSNPEIFARLHNELKETQRAKQAKLEYQDLRNLPYLTAVINEGLRTSNSISGRLVRYTEVADLHYKQYSLPRGTFISINMNDTHMDPSIYTNPEKFLPDRWLKESEHRRLSKYLQPWGRGARLCLGMELAYYDLYLAIAHLFGPDCGFNMKLYDTTEEDWDAYGDFFAPMPAPGARGLRVLVEPKEKLVEL